MQRECTDLPIFLASHAITSRVFQEDAHLLDTVRLERFYENYGSSAREAYTMYDDANMEEYDSDLFTKLKSLDATSLNHLIVRTLGLAFYDGHWFSNGTT